MASISVRVYENAELSQRMISETVRVDYSERLLSRVQVVVDNAHVETKLLNARASGSCRLNTHARYSLLLH